jgi:hypothetical protein
MARSLSEKISESRRLLKNPYAYLNETGGYSALHYHGEHKEPSREEITKSRKLLQDPYAHIEELEGFSAALNRLSDQQNNSGVSRKKIKERRYSYDEIEKRVKNLHRAMWQNKNEIWLDSVPSNPVEMLDPFIALKYSGYECDLEETLGQFYCDGKLVETAGVIDRTSARVSISRQFDSNVRNFTAAHELGHALLHQTSGLHRDRPLDGSSRSQDVREIEADKFATYFLMPERLVKTNFKKFFLTECFGLNEETAHALGLGDLMQLQAKVQTLRQLSRIVASAEKYNGVHFRSLASQFHVSTEAMAIRLEELGLLELKGSAS